MMDVKNEATPAEKKEPPPSKEPLPKVAKDTPNRWPHCFAAKSTSREFFERVMSSKHNGEDRSDLFIPYW